MVCDVEQRTYDGQFHVVGNKLEKLFQSRATIYLNRLAMLNIGEAMRTGTAPLHFVRFSRPAQIIGTGFLMQQLVG